MNEIVLPRQKETSAVELPLGAARRAAPRSIKVLLPVWGFSYVRQFLDYGLPTLLAPGNLPALAQALPTELVLLTSSEDARYIHAHPVFKLLSAVCDVDVRPIDHLITGSNYSTTITLAYAETVRSAGDAMLDTCFFFLVSDYIMADGSLANALKRMQHGASAVVVGNFQVEREDALPWLRNKLTAAGGVLALPSRELMRWALKNLHPVMLANIVNVPFSHNAHSNRLFWRVDENTILGRFYLMHMLCVRPEKTDFIIGASCDYSFVPEMCPSGAVQVITDSDEYLVIEMQPRGHEGRYLQQGPITPRRLARSLSQWTTRTHRDNVKYNVLFHAGDLPNLTPILKQADVFVSKVARHLRSKPFPHRGHPYWRGAIAEFYDATGRRFTDREWRETLGLRQSTSAFFEWLVWHGKYSLMGFPPRLMPWHPAWPDLRAATAPIAPFFDDPSQKLLIVSNEPTMLSQGLVGYGERVVRLRCVPLMKHPQRYSPLKGSFNLCLWELSEQTLWQIDRLLDCIAPLMEGNGRIVLFISNLQSGSGSRFGNLVASQGDRFIRSGFEVDAVHFVPASRLRGAASHAMQLMGFAIRSNPLVGLPLAALRAPFVFAMAVLGNLGSVLRLNLQRPPPTSSSCVIELRVSKTRGTDQTAVRGLARIPPRTTSTSGRSTDLKDTVGLGSVARYPNHLWDRDPRQLGMLLARYRFIAAMLNGVRDAGEVGCADPFCSRVVAQEVPDLTIYDADRAFIENARGGREERWPVQAVEHNILKAKLPRIHEALFSLDMLEWMSPADGHIYLTNLCGSLAGDGILIIGTINGATDPAAPANSKSGEELKGLLEQYFSRVFVVSMCGGVTYAGVMPTAEYLFAICALGKRLAFDRDEVLPISARANALEME